MTTKQDVIRAMTQLPENASVEDAMERLYLLYKVERGLEESQTGKTVSKEEARERLSSYPWAHSWA